MRSRLSTLHRTNLADGAPVCPWRVASARSSGRYVSAARRQKSRAARRLGITPLRLYQAIWPGAIISNVKILKSTAFQLQFLRTLSLSAFQPFLLGFRLYPRSLRIQSRARISLAPRTVDSKLREPLLPAGWEVRSLKSQLQQTRGLQTAKRIALRLSPLTPLQLGLTLQRGLFSHLQ